MGSKGEEGRSSREGGRGEREVCEPVSSDSTAY